MTGRNRGRDPQCDTELEAIRNRIRDLADDNARADAIIGEISRLDGRRAALAGDLAAIRRR